MSTIDTESTTRRGGWVDRYFMISARGSDYGREIRGGLATFFTMAYIVVLNPLIIGTVADADGQLIGDGTDPASATSAVAFWTALVAGVLTIAMGVFGRYPFALATGLGLNAFVVFSIASRMSFEDAMGLVVLEGLVITLLVLTGFRVAVFHAIPAPLKAAIAVGIGLFIALVGFVDAGFVQRVPDAANTVVPVQLGSGGVLTGWPMLVFALGLVGLIVLVALRVRGAILIGIIATTLLAVLIQAVTDAQGWRLNKPELPDRIVGGPEHNLLGEFSLFGGFARVGIVAAVLLVFTLMLADFFDTMGTVVGVGAQGDLLDERRNLPGAREVLLVDSLGAAAGGAASVSSNTTYIESAAGVGEGARTGLASVVTGLLFLVAMFFAPLVTVVPFEAATPALIVVGFLMMTQIRTIDFSDIEIAIPAFLTIVLMPFTYSIANGIGAGFIGYVVIKAARGKWREVHPLLWLVAALFAVYFAIEPIKDLLGVG